MSSTPFEKLLVWNKAREHVKELYRVFKRCNDYAFKDQILRAGISMLNNIAEGCESNTDKEFARYIHISKASAGEVRSMLYLGSDLGYVEEKQLKYLIDNNCELSRMLYGLIKSLK